MDNTLVIKNTNFSSVAVKQVNTVNGWIFGYTDAQINLNDEALFDRTFYFAPSQNFDSMFLNKTIKGLKISAVAVGTITVYKFDKNGTDDVVVGQYDLSIGINKIWFESPVECGSNYKIAIKSNTANILKRSSVGWNFCSSTNRQADGTPGFCIDFAY